MIYADFIHRCTHRFSALSLLVLLSFTILLPHEGSSQSVVVHFVNGESEAIPVAEISKIKLQGQFLRIYKIGGEIDFYHLSLVTRYDFDFTSNISEPEENNILDLVLFPNPAVSSVSVSFELRNATQVQLQLLDLQGREVASKNTGTMPPGKHQLEFSPPQILPGYYLMRVVTTEETHVHPILFTATK
jgi:hypothetical protein